VSANPTDLLARVTAMFDRAPFIRAVGIVPESAAPGVVTALLPVRPEHLQQDGFVHAGLQATLADHAAGAAALTTVGPDQTLLSVEFKLNLLRPATGPLLRARAEVLRAGRRLVVVECSVFGERASARVLVAKATVTLAVVAADVGTSGNVGSAPG
jgi:uncharacterized protein (TIGR00369 family)